MPNPKTRNRLFTLALALALALTGCAAIEKQEAQQQASQTEQLLSAAGFQMKLADTPQKLAHLQALTPLKLAPHPRDGKIYFIYADAQFCQCLYAGDQAAYQRYQRLAVAKNIANEQRLAAQMNEDAAMNWGMWGPWGMAW